MFECLKILLGDKEAEERRRERLLVRSAVEVITHGVSRAQECERSGGPQKLTKADVELEGDIRYSKTTTIP